MRRPAAIVCALWLALAVPAEAQQHDASLRRVLATSMRSAGAASGAYVLDASGDRPLFQSRARVPRILASNTKIFTTAAALDRLGPESTLSTRVLGSGSLDEAGTWRGDLYLRGGGDPSFGSGPFVRRAYGTGASVEALATKLEAAGIVAVRGRVLGDEGRFDALRGGPDSRYAVSRVVGPLSALAFNRGLANERGSAFQVNPPAFAAARLAEALERRGIRVRGAARAGVTPPGVDELAAVESPALARLAQITNKRSDNYFAETLLKAVSARDGQRGTTAAGARAAAGFARELGARPQLTDGSGLARSNRASPRDVATALARLRDRDLFSAFFESLPIAGRDGTLHDRMRGGAARGRCRAKTGTLRYVSTLSGYCAAAGGRTLVFSFLMNGVGPIGARRLQDRMTNALVRYRGPPNSSSRRSSPITSVPSSRALASFVPGSSPATR